MKLNTIINRYIFREMIPTFVINLLVLAFIFLMTSILDITNLVVSHRVSISSVVLILMYSMPFFLIFVIPMSVMMAVLLTFLRLSGDNEIVALKAGGFNVYALLPPVFVFCLIGLLMTSFMSVYGLPWGRLSFKALAFEVAKSNIDMGLKERTFNDSFKGVMLYVNKIDTRDRALTDVFLEDHRASGTVTTVVAPKGRYYSDPERLTFQLRLYNGVMNQADLSQKSWHSVDFETYDFNLDLQRIISQRKEGPKDEEEMSLEELRQSLKDAKRKDAQYYLTLMEYHKKFSIPFACLVLGMTAVPLGIQSKNAKRSFGIGVGLFFFLVYYIFLSAGWVFGEAGMYPPIIGMWVPNLVLGGIAAYLMFMTANERPVRMIQMALALLQRCEAIFRKG
jgi:lipopolysaccharide export system permease protein